MVSNVERWKGCRCVAAGVKMDPLRFVRLKLPENRGEGESGRIGPRFFLKEILAVLMSIWSALHNHRCERAIQPFGGLYDGREPDAM